MKKFLKAWLVPIIIAVLLFVAVRPTFAQLAEGEEITLANYLVTGSVVVGEETTGGYRQVYYLYKDQKNFITGGGANSHNPVSTGEYIVYLKDINGAPQVFLFNILTDTTIQLSSTESNNAPYVSREGNVVWEGWTGDPSTSSGQGQKWQVFLFDGKSVTQLTSGDLAISPYIEGDMIVYARRDIAGEWRSSLYSMRVKSEKDITVGNKTQFTKLRNGKIVFELPGSGAEEFTLTADDLFTLDLAPLTATDSAQTVTIKEILQELEMIPPTSVEEATREGEMNF